MFPAFQGGFFTTGPQGSPMVHWYRPITTHLVSQGWRSPSSPEHSKAFFMGEAEARVDIRRGQMVSPTTGEDISSLTQETFIKHLLGHGPGFTKTVCVCVCVCVCTCTCYLWVCVWWRGRHRHANSNDSEKCFIYMMRISTFFF